MTKKIIILTIMLLVTLLLTGCSFALPWTRNATSTTNQPSNAPSNTTSSGNSSPNFTINIPDQSSEKTIAIPGVIGKGQKIFLNDKEVIADENGNFIANVDLIPGINPLRVKVFSKDSSSIYSTGKNITYTPQIPKLSITSPIPSTYASENPSIIIMGKTDPNSKITSKGTSILPDANGNFIITVPLNSGDNIIKLDSTNPSGLVNSFQQVINFIKIDKKPKPNLVVSLPDTGFVSSKDITINGFTDSNNIIEVYNNYNNSINAVKSLIFKGSINKGTFAIPVSLSDGSNTLLIRATNEYNITTDLTKTVTYKK